MEKYENIFQKFLYEAPEDDPPPPELDNVNDIQNQDDNPPELNNQEENIEDDMPPELDSDLGTEDFMGGMDDESDGSGGNNNSDDQEEDVNKLPLDEKISAIMNERLYQRFLSLKNNVGNQIDQIKDNSDILYAINPSSLDILDKLEKLKENIRIYSNHKFTQENYSINLLFFNKCINLLSLLNQSFDDEIQKGIRKQDNK